MKQTKIAAAVQGFKDNLSAYSSGALLVAGMLYTASQSDTLKKMTAALDNTSTIEAASQKANAEGQTNWAKYAHLGY